MSIKPLQIPSYPVNDLFNFSSLGSLGQNNNNSTLGHLANLYAPSQGGPAASPPVTSQGLSPSPGGTSAAFTAPASTGDVDAAINATAPIAGMDVPRWKAIASIESSLNPSSNVNRNTQYKGLFQIGSRGDGSEWQRHGSGSIYNPMDNASAAAALAAENNATFKKNFGRDPTPTETYMMHQQGPGFYLNGTMTNIEGNPYPGMSGPQTPQSFEAGWGREIERRAKYFQGDSKDSSRSDGSTETSDGN